MVTCYGMIKMELFWFKNHSCGLQWNPPRNNNNGTLMNMGLPFVDFVM